MDVFDVYYASLVAMSLHPGYSREGTEKLTIEKCAEIALKMLDIRNEVLKCQPS